MSVLVISEVSAGTAEQDRALVEALKLESDPPAGLLARLGGPTQTGWRIAGLWESREAFDSYFHSRVTPARQQAGLSIPEPEFWPIESVIII